MKFAALWSIVGICLVLTITGCQKKNASDTELAQPSPLIGSWIISGTAESPTMTIQFREDSRFSLTADGTATPDAEGSYSVTGNQLILQNEGLTATGDCTLSATYSFVIEGDSLKFERLQDDLCGSRVAHLGQVWMKH